MRLLIGLLISLIYVTGAALESVDMELEHQQTIHITHEHPSDANHEGDTAPHTHCVSVGGCSHCLTLPNIGLTYVTATLDVEPLPAVQQVYEDPILASIFRPPIA